MVENNLLNLDLSDYQGILWDLDNTLYAYEPAHEFAYSASVKKASEDYNISESDFESNWNTARKWVHHQLNGLAASHSRLLYFQRLYEQIYNRSNARFSLEMESCYWNNFLKKVSFKPGMEEFLLKAKNLNKRMCLVTDLTAQIQFQKWEKLQLHRFFDFMVSSEEAGVEKPEPEMFELALQKMKLKPENVIMIGDNPEKDIKGAKALGIKSILIE